MIAIYLALDSHNSLNYMLPFNLTAERTAVFVYDIEDDGTLLSGEGYPAVTMELRSNNTSANESML